MNNPFETLVESVGAKVEDFLGRRITDVNDALANTDASVEYIVKLASMAVQTAMPEVVELEAREPETATPVLTEVHKPNQQTRGINPVETPEANQLPVKDARRAVDDFFSEAA